MNNIEIYNETSKEISELSELKKTLNYALRKEKVKNVELNLIIVSNKRIKNINKKYRGVDASTDVITFALEDEKDFPNMKLRILGDIYISIDKVKSQAKLFEHSFLRELSFLAVHGLFHLLGYDHQTKAEEKVMFQKQEEILSDLNIKRGN